MTWIEIETPRSEDLKLSRLRPQQTQNICAHFVESSREILLTKLQ